MYHAEVISGKLNNYTHKCPTYLDVRMYAMENNSKRLVALKMYLISCRLLRIERLGNEEIITLIKEADE